MRRIAASILFLLVFGVRPTPAQQILPNSVSGWTSGPAAPLAPQGASDAQLAAATAREYGFVKGEQRSYSMGSDSLQVSAYQMKDPSGAYGEYSYLRAPDMAQADFAEHSSASQNRALVLVGNLVVDIQGRDIAKNSNDLKAIVAAVKSHAQQGPLPTIMNDLPQDGMVPRTDRYILGPVALNQFFPAGSKDDWLGFSYGAEVEVAHYRVKGQDATLAVADFPTPQVAADELARYKNLFNVNGSKTGTPPIFAKRSVTLITMVSGVATQADADALMNQVHSQTVLTWNEPTFQFKEPDIGTIVVGTIIGTGVICLFAMIAGLAFGGFRLAIKRALPNKIFDRPAHLELLQLGLASKPIKSEDFYDGGWVSGKESKQDKKLPDRTALRIFR